MFLLNEVKTVISFFFTTGIRSKRTKLFFIFSLLPSIVLIILQIVILTNPQIDMHLSRIYPEIESGFYFQLFIQLISLLLASSIINDEIENMTLIYLTTSPIKKSSIIFGKFMAHFLITSLTISFSLLISFLIAYFPDSYNATRILELMQTLLVAYLGILAYSAVFVFLETFIKKTILLGIFFIFGWEKVIQFFPGITQKLTVIHFINSLLPFSSKQKAGFLTSVFEKSPSLVSIIVLLLVSFISLMAGIYIFHRKEYILAEGL